MRHARPHFPHKRGQSCVRGSQPAAWLPETSAGACTGEVRVGVCRLPPPELPWVGRLRLRLPIVPDSSCSRPLRRAAQRRSSSSWSQLFLLLLRRTHGPHCCSSLEGLPAEQKTLLLGFLKFRVFAHVAAQTWPVRASGRRPGGCAVLFRNVPGRNVSSFPPRDCFSQHVALGAGLRPPGARSVPAHSIRAWAQRQIVGAASGRVTAPPSCQLLRPWRPGPWERCPHPRQNQEAFLFF